MIVHEQLQKYLELFVPDETERTAVLEQLDARKDGSFSFGDVVRAYEAVGRGEAETIICASIALSLCKSYGKMFDLMKIQVKDNATQASVANDITGGLWGVLMNDKRGMQSPLARVLLEQDATEVSFGSSREIWVAATEKMAQVK